MENKVLIENGKVTTTVGNTKIVMTNDKVTLCADNIDIKFRK